MKVSYRIWESFHSIVRRYNLKVLVKLRKTKRTSCFGVCFLQTSYLLLYVNRHYYLGQTKINEIVVDICRMAKQWSCPGNGLKTFILGVAWVKNSVSRLCNTVCRVRVGQHHKNSHNCKFVRGLLSNFWSSSDTPLLLWDEEGKMSKKKGGKGWGGGGGQLPFFHSTVMSEK